MINGAKYLWKLPEPTTQAVLDLARSYNLSIPIMHTLVSRGMTTKESSTAISLARSSVMLLIQVS